MTPAKFATTALWLTTFVLPMLVFLSVSARASRVARLCAAVLAIAAGWCFEVAYAVAARAIALSDAAPQAQLAIFNRDGAPLAFAATFGWIPAVVAVVIAWAVRAALIPRIKGQ